MKELNRQTKIIGIMVLVTVLATSGMYAQRLQRFSQQQTRDDLRLHQNMRPGRMLNQTVDQGRFFNRNLDGRGMGLFGLNLTEEQQLKINELRTSYLKEMLPYNNEMNEKTARLRTLTTAENINQKEIDKLIDDMSAARAKQMKQKIAHQQEIRSLLTDEQRVIFDSSNRGSGQRQFARNNGRSGNRAMRPGSGFRTR